MRQKVHNFFVGGDHFRKEFKHQVRLLITITLGFTIAFSWRQTIFDASESLVNFFIKVKTSTASSVLTSIFITILSLIIIYLTSQFLKDRSEYYH